VKHTYQYSEKQLAIINVAERLFAEKGFDGASVRDIAHAAEVNVAMISYYFGSKEKLMEAVFEKKSTNIRLKVENLLQETSIPHLQKVNILIDDYVEKFLDQQQFHKIMIREQMIDKDTPIAAMIHELKKRNLDSIRKLIQDGQKNGAFRPDVDVVLMMTTLIGTVSNLITTQQFYRKINNMELVPEMEFQSFMKKQLNAHLKNIFKSLLTNEK
jgi:AcrR family transcriptional regulator